MLGINVVEGVKFVAVNVEDGEQLTIGGTAGHNDFGFAAGVAGNVAGELMDIGDDKCLVLSDTGPADTLRGSEFLTGQRALIGADEELIIKEAIEPDPEKVAHLAGQKCRSRSHASNRVRGGSEDGFKLGDDALVALSFLQISHCSEIPMRF